MTTHTPVRKLGSPTRERAEPGSATRPRRVLTAAESALVLLIPSSTPLRACLLIRRRLLRHVPTVVAFATASNAAQALQNERTGANSSSSLRTSCPWPSSSSRRLTSAGSNALLSSCSRSSSSASALTLHRVCGNQGLLTAQRPIDGARAPPLIPCPADDFALLRRINQCPTEWQLVPF